MRFKLGVLAALVTALGVGVLGGVVPHASADSGNGNDCVGSAVSEVAHVAQDVYGVGFGTLAHDLGQNPGQAIQEYATVACGKH